MNKIELEIGQTILLELEDECLLGQVAHVASDRSFIRLADVRDMTTKKNYGVQTYYNSEVRNIQIASTDDTPKLQSNPTDSIIKSKQLSLASLNSALEQINNYVFIHQTDAKYHDSIAFLKKQHYFGVAMECIENGRHSHESSLLTIATVDSIYIFDIKWMRITDDMRDLLSNDRYRRVLHNGRLMGDVLLHKYGIPLGKCFDVMVAHIAISKNAGHTIKNNLVSLQTCLRSYLNLPEKFFDVNINFRLRPLSDAAKKEAAKHAAFLLPLQDFFVHEIMLEPFYNSCISYTRSLSRNADFINSLADLRNKGPEAIEAIQPAQLGIDVESLKLSEHELTSDPGKPDDCD
uniref:3'-5' exonuclease domain-containing protein n=1 Tax=Anopheles culicifacies TaxID=139723 RepID=A0A182LZ97_9DIPT